MSTKSKPKLTIELVPSTCHFSNVRTTIKPKEWDKVRFISYEAAGHKCEICGDTGKNQGYKHSVECHEIWYYNDTTHVQQLVGLVSLCPICHQVKHIGRAIAMGKERIVHRQLRKVNQWSQAQVDAHIKQSFEIYAERSQHEWELDISLLEEEPYCIKVKKSPKRKFKVKKYKKRKRKKVSVKKTLTKKKLKRRPKKN